MKQQIKETYINSELEASFNCVDKKWTITIEPRQVAFVGQDFSLMESLEEIKEQLNKEADKLEKQATQINHIIANAKKFEILATAAFKTMNI